ncbi:MFS transporter [Actinopolymorpha rutila]|uniref:DHA2 family multidrug resistance protein-like MFS transporter n=1 Tax=Actinopolymorpha rutila TaxID=446787 RepID=A0A852ZTL3_9ACTN|nr:DHA2 family multidrug resistance protein-like MFS transporter [Actinopolymorpha rutila]
MTSQSTAPGPRASRREWTGLAVLALPTLLLSLDMSVLYLALPHLSEDLGATATQQLWVMDIYSFMIAGFLVTMGTLGDRIGRRRLLMIGGTAFAVASVLAAYSTSAEMLIATRALLGVAGATLMPSTLSLIGTMFRDQHQRGVAIAVWMTCFMVGMTVGPLVGGVLLQNFWWGSAFLLGVPVMVLLLATAPSLLPEFRDEQSGRIDLASVALSLATVLPVVYGLKELAHGGWQAGPALAVVAGLAFGVLFCRRQVRLDDPLLDLDLFRSRRFSTALCMNFGGAIVMAGTFLLISQYLQLVAGLSPLRAGLATIPVNVAMAISSMLTPQLARRFRPALVSAGGFAIAALGLVVVALAAGRFGLTTLLVGFALASVGIAAPSALGVNLIVGAAPPTKAGAASGMSETSGELGVALGVATLGSIAAAFYVARVSVPAGVPAAAADAARESLPGAVVTAGGLSDPMATALLGSARSAFTGGLAIAAVVGAVILAAVAVVAGVMFRHLRSYGDETAAESAEPAESADPVDAATRA